ncbi:hypothetical protein [Streptomyces sp. NRRL S-4]|uniref:hypothetical protein n=1 Tax=Streptomyces sp. NRRL S-4 TaxID=1519471 RepID=UPI0006B3FD85|nr:hypothetical protein [Streptomyces sp. NRRL S-4]KPC80313.1 hypothetical protein ADK82_22965 [Streptomyces sp. NRRL S-4]
MPRNRRVARRTDALTRASVRRGVGPRPARPEEAPAEETPGRMRYLRSPATWLVGILLAVVTVTFQDVLAASVKTILPLDRVPDRLSPQDAIDVVEVRDVKEHGYYAVRDDPDGKILTQLTQSAWRQDPSFVDVGDAYWMITLQGRAAQQVRITDIVPELVGSPCKANLGGNLVQALSQGVMDVIPLQVAVDSPQPRLKASGKDGKAAEPFFTGPGAKHITLNQNETEAFIVHATSEKGYCRWRYRVRYEVGGSTAEMTIGAPGGEPFELTGELSDTSDYSHVYFSGLACRKASSPMPDKWYEQTGAEYARDQRRSGTPPCPKG